eukprot:TRINITY_DN3443_c0_g1_i1.p1 TRINITY_DN3443_c0_g1~~TRINITY_DN3443_c0_g1_i1.p1  ORF type:complete len:103 (+),score=16.38 TRINITY_DN3443_c0_g1_i1:149-457(+)
MDVRHGIDAFQYNGCTAKGVISKYGSDVQKIDKDGNTSLHRAAENGDLTAVRVLLKVFGGNVHAKNKRGKTSLHLAIGNGHEAVVRVLVELGADVRAKAMKD